MSHDVYPKDKIINSIPLWSQLNTLEQLKGHAQYHWLPNNQLIIQMLDYGVVIHHLCQGLRLIFYPCINNQEFNLAQDYNRKVSMWTLLSLSVLQVVLTLDCEQSIGPTKKGELLKWKSHHPCTNMDAFERTNYKHPKMVRRH